MKRRQAPTTAHRIRKPGVAAMDRPGVETIQSSAEWWVSARSSDQPRTSAFPGKRALRKRLGWHCQLGGSSSPPIRIEATSRVPLHDLSLASAVCKSSWGDDYSDLIRDWATRRARAFHPSGNSAAGLDLVLLMGSTNGNGGPPSTDLSAAPQEGDWFPGSASASSRVGELEREPEPLEWVNDLGGELSEDLGGSNLADCAVWRIVAVHTECGLLSLAAERGATATTVRLSKVSTRRDVASSRPRGMHRVRFRAQPPVAGHDEVAHWRTIPVGRVEVVPARPEARMAFESLYFTPVDGSRG